MPEGVYNFIKQIQIEKMTEISDIRNLFVIDCNYYAEKTYEERLELLRFVYTLEKDNDFNRRCNLFYNHKYRGHLEVMLPSVESGLLESLNFDDYFMLDKTTGF
jgi:hypothetical protein